MKEGLLGTVALVEEREFLGAASGSTYAVAGLREFEPGNEFGQRSVKVGAFRTQKGFSTADLHWRGRLDIEATCSPSTRMLLGLLLRSEGSQVVAEGTRHDFGLTRAGDQETRSAKFRCAFDGGPWHEYSGVMVESLRLTVRAQDIAHVSATWAAAGFLQYDTDPGWEFVRAAVDPVRASAASLTVDGDAFDDALEASFEIKQSLVAQKRASAWRLSRSGPMGATGSLVEYYGSAADLPAKVRSATSFALALQAAAPSGRYVRSLLPVCAPNAGLPSPLEFGDVIDSVAFVVLDTQPLTLSLVLE